MGLIPATKTDDVGSGNQKSEIAYLLGLPMKSTKEVVLQGIANAICKHIPHDYVISLCYENGSAWVELRKNGVGDLELPDSSDSSLLERIEDALLVANGRIEK